MRIHLKMEAFHDNGNGTLTVEVATKPITNEQAEVLEQLFPNLPHLVDQLLVKEALFASVATESQLTAPKIGKQQSSVGVKNNEVASRVP